MDRRDETEERAGDSTATNQSQPDDKGEPLSTQGFVLRLIFGVFLIMWWLLRGLMTAGGKLGAFGVLVAVGGPILTLVLFLDQDWYARQGAGESGGDELTGLGSCLFFGLFLAGVVLWIVGIVRKRAARRRLDARPAPG
jgi:hypothetical protein